jgi:hypothetical protein
MPPRKKYTTKEAADACSREHSHIRRLCVALGLGEVVSVTGAAKRARLLSGQDMLRLKQHIAKNGNENKRRTGVSLQRQRGGEKGNRP